MIRVVYRREIHRLTMEGHAGSGEAGHDLVCSAASMLAYTLAANVYGIKKQGQAEKVMVKLEVGNADIGCRPREQFQNIVTVIFDSVCVGFKILAESYPENMAYIIE